MRNSAYEALLTAVLLFGVASVVCWVIGASPISQAIPGIHLELLVVGVVVGLLLAGLILSPLGKASGGHLNPAISLAMWRFGVFPGRGVLPYGAAQLAGSLLGVLLARAAWGPSVARPPVLYGALRPAQAGSQTPTLRPNHRKTPEVRRCVGTASLTLPADYAPMSYRMRGSLTAPRLTITACCSEVEDGHQMGDRGHGRG